MLRLALDAARLGTMRVFSLPTSSTARKTLLDEVRVWSQIRGLGYHRLADGPDTGAQKLERLVLTLLLERGACSRQMVEHFGLKSVIPLDLLGDLALVGYPLVGHLVIHRGGHELHTEFATKILQDTDAWRLEEPVVDPAVSGVPVALPVKRSPRLAT